MSSNHAGHALHAVKHTAESLDPLPHGKRKNPALAALLGFTFGCIGIGVYLESFKDALISFLIMLALTIIIPGLGLVISLLILAGYGYSRAESSNKKLGFQ